MRTEKLELDKDSGTNTLAAMFSRRFLGLSAAGLFRNTPNTTPSPGKLSRKNYGANSCTVVGHLRIPR